MPISKLLQAIPPALFILALTAKADTAPCWFNEPIQNDQAGALGLARDLNVGSGNPLQFSRHRALTSLSNYLGLEHIPPRRELDINSSETSLGNYNIYFADEFHYGGYVYSYASIQPYSEDKNTQQCQIQQCDFQQCNPAWLCEPNLDKQAGLLGTSFRSSSMPAQYNEAINNALQQLEPLYGVNISVNDRFYTNYSSMGTLRLLLSDSELSMAQQQQDISLRYLVSNSCQLGEQLFLRVSFPELPPLSSVPASTWMKNPSTEQLQGAIGSVHGRVASTLLSDKIRLAIKRGLIALAKAKNSNISAELLSIERNNRYYQVSAITEESEVSLHARVNGIHFNHGPTGVAVYAWLVETDGVSP